MAYNSDAVIYAIEFSPEGGFIIHYSEQTDLTPIGMQTHQFTVNGGVPGTENLPVREIIDSIRELLDLAIVAGRNDPQEIRSHLKR